MEAQKQPAGYDVHAWAACASHIEQGELRKAPNWCMGLWHKPNRRGKESESCTIF